ncbi:MAG: ABC transporter ATP-binding protein, partial [bacterium]
ESGCGKTTLGRTMVRLIAPTEGRLLYRQNEGSEEVDLAAMNQRQLRPFRRDIQIIFQDPFSSLNDRLTVERVIAEPMQATGTENAAERRARVAELLEAVGLSRQHLDRYPHEFSGGQRQRIAIARALAVRPKLIVCDEPVSALDVSVQAQVINLLKDLQDDFGFTYIFVAHDLSVVRHISTRVAVMYLGRIVECADTFDIFNNPQHPYTEALLASVPSPDPRKRMDTRRLLTGAVPNPSDPPAGCHFHPRCRYATEACRRQDQVLQKRGGGGSSHSVACMRHAELTLEPSREQSLAMSSELPADAIRRA